MAFGRKNGNSSFVMTLNMYCNFKGPINTINIKKLSWVCKELLCKELLTNAVILGTLK